MSSKNLFILKVDGQPRDSDLASRINGERWIHLALCQEISANKSARSGDRPELKRGTKTYDT